MRLFSTALVRSGGPAFRDVRSISYRMVLLGLPLVLALAAILLIPATVPMPDYLRDAQQYASSGHISDTTYPVAFAWLAGIALKALGNRGIEVLQAVFYITSVLAIWVMARECGASPRSALGAAVIASIYPQLPDSVTKLWDVEISVWLVVLFMLLTVWLWRDGPRPLIIVTLGFVAGFSLAQRPNMLLLVPLPAYLCLTAKAAWRRKLIAFLACGAIAAATLGGINIMAHGSFFLSQNGPYNLVQGHNEFTVRTLLDDLTCEPSVGMILKADGMPSTGFNEADPTLQVYFKRRALDYIRAHPLGEVRITAVKLWTLFRPNTRIHHGLGGMTVAIVCMSLIFPVWLIMLFRTRARTGLNAVDRIFIAASVLYVLPFLITSSDPRYQIPLEICMLAHIAAMLAPHSAEQERIAV